MDAPQSAAQMSILTTLRGKSDNLCRCRIFEICTIKNIYWANGPFCCRSFLYPKLASCCYDMSLNLGRYRSISEAMGNGLRSSIRYVFQTRRITHFNLIT